MLDLSYKCAQLHCSYWFVLDALFGIFKIFPWFESSRPIWEKKKHMEWWNTLLLLLVLRKSSFVLSPFFIFRGCAVASWHCLLADYSEQCLIAGKTNKFLKLVENLFKVISFKRNKTKQNKQKSATFPWNSLTKTKSFKCSFTDAQNKQDGLIALWFY